MTREPKERSTTGAISAADEQGSAVLQEPQASLVQLLQEIAQGLITDRLSLQKAKLNLARTTTLASFPTNATLLAQGRSLLGEGRLTLKGDGTEDGAKEQAMVLARLERVLRSKPVRTLAGVATVAIMTSPTPCPHGTCIYCPGGVSAKAGPVAVAGPWETEGTPQSYTGHEPAARRGARHNYDAHAQVRSRLEQYRVNGHPCDKVDLIVMGGTFTCRPIEEQLRFITEAFQAFNDIHVPGSRTDEVIDLEEVTRNEKITRVKDVARTDGVIQLAQDGRTRPPTSTRSMSPTSRTSQMSPTGHVSQMEPLEPMDQRGQMDQSGLWDRVRRVHSINGSAPHRVIGLTLETRPDQCSQRQVRQMVELGATRVELGVQVLDDEVLSLIGRDHSVEDIAQATANLKQAGLKVGYHLMPGLPGMDPDRDVAAFQKLWDDPRYRPDMLKLYPTLVVQGTQLERMWRAGEYTPYDNATATEVIARMKAHIPPYVRVQRIQRDIPAHHILAGVTAGNLRQLARGALADRGSSCQCIRCNEAGLKGLSEDGRGEMKAAENDRQDMRALGASGVTGAVGATRPDGTEVSLVNLSYASGKGQEHFMSYRKDDGTLLAYCRLRLEPPWAMIRELKVVGQAVPLDDTAFITERAEKVKLQHRGLGRRLMEHAEHEALQAGLSQMRVTSGVGVRPYYRERGYHLEEGYMVRTIDGTR